MLVINPALSWFEQCAACYDCCKRKQPLRIVRPPLNVIEIAPKPFRKVKILKHLHFKVTLYYVISFEIHIDLFGPIVDENGDAICPLEFKYCLITVDSFTKVILTSLCKTLFIKMKFLVGYSV